MLAAEQLAPGTPFGGYEITRLLGKGSFGSVYEALKLPLRRRVAIKLLHDGFTADEKIVGRFLREAESAARLHHPHIVETFDVGVVDGLPFIAMEFLEGESLKQRLLREGALSPQVAADIVLPVLSAVAAVHEAGIVHRDLKPENIQLENRLGTLHPKVLDFGIAKAADQRNLSAIGTKLGSPLYMSPEQHDGKVVDARTDLWSLGVVLFQCVTGKSPFQATTLPQLYRKIVIEPTPPLRLLNPSIPVTFEAVVQRALQKDPAARFPDAREMGAALFPFASPVVQHALQREFGMNVQLSASGVQRAEESIEPGSTMAWNGPVAAPTFPFSSQAARPSAPASVSQSVPAAPAYEPATIADQRSSRPGSIAPTVEVAAFTGPFPAHLATQPTAPSVASTPSSKRGLMLVGVGVIALALSAGVAAVGLSGESAPTSAPTAPPAPSTRRVQMRVLPPNATLQLDNHPPVLGSLDETIADDGRTHTIRVSAAGHEPQSFTFMPASPPPASVTLAALPTAEPAPRATPVPPPAVARTAVRAPTPSAVAEPPRVRRRRNRDSIGNL